MKTVLLISGLSIVLVSVTSFAQREVAPVVEVSKTGPELRERLNLTTYNDNYYAYGDPSTKVQFSFKYQMIESLPVYFGYTQLMFWLQQQDSEPFKDVNYHPDIFYRLIGRNKILDSIDFSPYAHVSNGRDGVDSRSLNRAYLRFNLDMPSSDQLIKLAVTLYSEYGLNEDNADIHDFISPLDLRFTFTQILPWIFDRGQLSLRIFPGGRWAENWSGGGRELGLSFWVGGFGLQPSVYIQYYSGYAESLLSYRRRESIVRAGIIL